MIFLRRIRKLTFEELVQENKEQLLNNKEALEQIEERWEKRRAER